MHRASIATLALATLGVASRLVAQHWRQATLEPRYGAAVAYDNARARVVLVGGALDRRGTQLAGDGGVDLWEWDGSEWQPRVPTGPLPPQRNDAALAPAPGGTLLLFGGIGANGLPLGDTWLWDGERWSSVSAAVAPPARSHHALEWDRRRSRTVLFGGTGSGSVTLGDTWEWDGSAWQQRSSPASPPARADAGLAFDPGRGDVVLFGGVSRSSGLDDTWVWDGSQWTLATPTAHPPAGAATMAAYDPWNEVVLPTGSQFFPYNDMWRWNGTDWTRFMAVNVPTSPGHVVQDRRRGVLVDATGPGVEQFSPYVWRSAGSFYPGVHGLLYDSARQEVIGSSSLGISAWTGVEWEQRPEGAVRPPAVQGFSTGFFDAGGSLVRFGGRMSSGTTIDQTWLWDGSQWTTAVPSTRPGPRLGGAMANDPLRDRLVLFGGLDKDDNPIDDTWEWDGTDWRPRIAATKPPAGAHVAVFDRTRGRTLLWVGDPTLGPQTWLWDGVDWQRAMPATSPPPRIGAALAHDPVRGVTLLYGGSDASGPLHDLWEWDGTTWSQASYPGSPYVTGTVGMAYDVARGRVILCSPVIAGATWELVREPESRTLTYGLGCGRVGPIQPRLAALGLPAIGNLSFGVQATLLDLRQPAALVLGAQQASLPLGGSCTLAIAQPLVVLGGTTNGSGTATWPLPVGATPALLRVELYAQALAVQSGGPGWTQGLHIVIGR